MNLYEEISNSPASFVAIRCALAVAILMQLSVSVCGALQAFLQAPINTNGRIQTWVEIPFEWWPLSWFEGGRSEQAIVRQASSAARSRTLRPPGVWSALGTLLSVLLLAGSLYTCGFEHADYIRRLPAYGRYEQERRHRAKLEFKDVPSQISKFIGAYYSLDPFSEKHPETARSITTSMIS